MSPAIVRAIKDWSFTQVGGGEGTKEGEWFEVSTFPTTVHVELLKLKKIPDPVSTNVHFETLTMTNKRML
jgi:beta-mannosidase